MEWMIIVNWLARIILVLLCGMSIYAVSIILERNKFFKNNSLSLVHEKLINLIEHKEFQKMTEFLAKENLFSAQIFMAINSDLSLKQIQNIGQLKFKKQEEGNLSVLGTFGSTAPFIGLLGTVFGIIVAFGELSTGKVDSNSIMFALAEALILTAVGLVVAIPSVISFNLYSKKLKQERERVYLIQELIKNN